jgi:hypothetical protein
MAASQDQLHLLLQCIYVLLGPSFQNALHPLLSVALVHVFPWRCPGTGAHHRYVTPGLNLALFGFPHQMWWRAPFTVKPVNSGRGLDAKWAECCNCDGWDLRGTDLQDCI